ncbi:hypothetical protein D9611_013284 [Ephemerocybe angulata]|uniref:F-box domain-containing protein n=1 Tax=Ephemerocybe angulata TaxID=980116 RepID=A0A8H5FIW3_9AGAR|nr:hypothetical protein D9611_013284 [Tulosesus angulatus]
MVREQATPLTDLLYNNAPPNTLDLAIIHDRTEAMAKRIVDLRNELEDLEKQLHLHKCVFSPARQIPTEILTMIFDAVSIVNPPYADEDWERDLESLTTITLVCKRWRDVAYSFGYLWAERKVEIPTLTQKQCGTLLRWYGRAKDTPKTLKFDTPYSLKSKCDCYKQTGGTQLCSNTILQRLLAEGPPLSRISMADFTPTCFKNIVRYIRSTNTDATTTSAAQHWWDKVQKLVLDFRDGSVNENDPYWLQYQLPTHSIFASFPDSLTSLALHLPRLVENPHRKFLDIPAAVLIKLTTLSLTYPWGGPQFLTALQHCTNVEILSLGLGDDVECQSPNLGDQVNVTPLSQDGHIVLPKVNSLTLEIDFASAEVKHLSLLRFPGLIELSIESGGNWGKPDPYSAILEAIGLFSTDAPQDLASLIVVGNIKAKDLYRLLGSITSPVTHLTMDAGYEPRKFLKLAQSAPTGTPNLLPSLQYLEVRSLPDYFHLDSLFLYIKSQKHGKQKGKVVMKAPDDSLKRVMLEITSWNRDLQKAYYKESATLKLLRETFGIKVDRMGYDPKLESDT